LGGSGSCRHGTVDGALEDCGQFVVIIAGCSGFGLDRSAPYRYLGTTAGGRRQTNVDATDAGIHRGGPLFEHTQELHHGEVKRQHPADEQSQSGNCGSRGSADRSAKNDCKEMPDHTATDAGTDIAGHDKKFERQQDTQNEYGHPGQLPAAAVIGIVLATDEHQDADHAHKQRQDECAPTEDILHPHLPCAPHSACTAGHIENARHPGDRQQRECGQLDTMLGAECRGGTRAAAPWSALGAWNFCLAHAYSAITTDDTTRVHEKDWICNK